MLARIQVTRKIKWILFATLAIAVGLYPLIYFILDRRFGLLRTKPNLVLTSVIWNVGFYTHILCGGLALLIGWLQFSKKFRDRNLRVHRRVGKVYVIAAMLSSLAGIYIGFYATGGYISAIGFISLGIFWFATTLIAYTSIRSGYLNIHQRMMIYSYAACFAAVTLRIWLPILTKVFGDFFIAYKIVAWLSWVPNLVVAYFIVRKLSGAVAVKGDN